MSFSPQNEHDEVLSLAEKHFNQGEMQQAETMLNQLVLQGSKKPLIFHMLGTIYYEQGKFNKAIRAFRRALEFDPSFTDASVGLSIILNDLGRYEEGKKVFEEAKTMLAQKSKEGDPYINEKLSIKHDELGEMYFQYGRYKEALEQYFKALNLSNREVELSMKIVDCYLQLEDNQQALKRLRDLCQNYPEYSPARVKLGKMYYESQNIPEAISQWEEVLSRDPENAQAKDYLRLAQSMDVVPLGDDSELPLEIEHS